MYSIFGKIIYFIQNITGRMCKKILLWSCEDHLIESTDQIIIATMVNPICAYTLVREGTPDPFLDYDGSDLKRCSSCKAVWYASVDAQRKQWKIHKKCCSLLDEETIEEIGRRSLDRIGKDLDMLLKPGGPYPGLYQLLKRLRELYDEKVDGYGDSACYVHSMARGVITYPNSAIVLPMVASPHIANYLFGDEEDLLNPKTRMAKYQLAKTNGRPSEEYIDAIDDENERKELKKLCDKYDKLEDCSWSEPGSMSFCYIYFNLIVACAIRGEQSNCSNHDGCGLLRGGDPRRKNAESLLATAALRRAMMLWTDKHVLASCGDAMAPAASLALTAVQYYEALGILGGPTCREYEIVPGLTFDRVVMTCMSELLDNAGNAEYSVKLLSLLGDNIDNYSFAWNDLPVERRARTILATIHYIINFKEKEDDEEEFDDEEDTALRFGDSIFGSRSIGMPSKAVNNIFKYVCGVSHSSLAIEVLKKAADSGEFIGPKAAGMNVETRAFVYFLIRANKLSDEWANLDVVKLAKEFNELPYICKAPDDERVREKDECLRLSRGDKLHKEMNEMLRR